MNRVLPGTIRNEAAMVRDLKREGYFSSGAPREGQSLPTKRAPAAKKAAPIRLLSRRAAAAAGSEYLSYLNNLSHSDERS